MSKKELRLLPAKVIGTISYAVNFLTGRPVGILITSLFLYQTTSFFGFPEPYSFSELILWIDQLPETSKTTVLTSLITISGFLVAFSINSSNQKNQLMSDMRIELAEEIEDFFNEFSRNITSANIYSEYLLKVNKTLKKSKDNHEINFHLDNIASETTKHIETRRKIQEQAIDVYRLKGKHSIIIASSWGAQQRLDDATRSVEDIVQSIDFPIPILNPLDPNKIQSFKRQIDTSKCNIFIKSYKDNFDIINQSSGGLSGSMLGTITGINLPLLINLLKTKK